MCRDHATWELRTTGNCSEPFNHFGWLRARIKQSEVVGQISLHSAPEEGGVERLEGIESTLLSVYRR